MDKLIDKVALIVDDEQVNIFALSSYLETLKIKCEIARNGREAMDMLQSGLRPDIILLDMMMPIMDGYETLELLRQDSTLKTIPVIAVTARAMKGDKEKCLEAGAWDYVSKPIDIKTLVEKMSYWTEHEYR